MTGSMVVSVVPAGQGDRQVLPLAVGQLDQADGPDADVGRRTVDEVPLFPLQMQRHGHHGDDPGGAEMHGRLDRDDLEHAAIDVVVVGQVPRREDQRDAGRSQGALNEVDRTGGVAGSRGAGIGLDDGAVLGHVAQDTGPQGGHGQADLEAGSLDQ